MYVVIYNALGSIKSRIVRLPVSVGGTFDVSKVGIQNHTASPQSFQAISAPFCRSSTTCAAKYVLYFDTGPLVPTGPTIFKVKLSGGNGALSTISESALAQDSRALQSHTGIHQEAIDVSVSNGLISVRFNR